MLPGLIRHPGGYDYTAIQVIFDTHGIEQAKRPATMAEIVKLINVIDAERKAREK